MKFKINTGEFKHPIKIEKFNEDKIIDDDGIPSEHWSPFIKTKAKITNLTFEELVIAEGQGYKKILNFYIRFPKSKKVTRKDRIYYDGNYYDIKSLDDVENAHRILALRGEIKE